MDGWHERCAECPVLHIERAMNTETGQVVSRAFEIQNDIECHIPPNLDEIPARVFAAVKTLRNESNRYQNERQERERDQH